MVFLPTLGSGYVNTRIISQILSGLLFIALHSSSTDVLLVDAVES
jgi:hypothetical protein